MILRTVFEQGMHPDVVDDSDPNNIYLGYYQNNRTGWPNRCLIKRINLEPINGKTIIKVRYPRGHFDFVFNWDDRATYTDWRYRDFPPEEYLLIAFDSIANVPVADAYSVTDWNTYLGLPAAGEPFISVVVDGNTVTLIGNSDTNTIDTLLTNTHVVSVTDTTGTVHVPPVAGGLSLTWDNIANVPVANTNSVADWNTFFDLPVNGTPFTSVVVTGNEVNLIGGSGITIKTSLFSANLHLTGINDNGNCVIAIQDEAFYNCSGLNSVLLDGVVTMGLNCFTECYNVIVWSFQSLVSAGDGCFYYCSGGTTFNFPVLTTAGAYCFGYCSGAPQIYAPLLQHADDGCFYGCSSSLGFEYPDLIYAGYACFGECSASTYFKFISLPVVSTYDFCFINCIAANEFVLSSCTNLGSSVGDNENFSGIAGQVITLTIPAALMTCNGGSPDGDIQYLQANNTVTIIQV